MYLQNIITALQEILYTTRKKYFYGQCYIRIYASRIVIKTDLLPLFIILLALTMRINVADGLINEGVQVKYLARSPSEPVYHFW